jgi:transposase-like protein
LDFELEDRTAGTAKATVGAEDDLRGLRRENQRLREEIELLKKAAIYFARGSR